MTEINKDILYVAKYPNKFFEFYRMSENSFDFMLLVRLERTKKAIKIYRNAEKLLQLHQKAVDTQLLAYQRSQEWQ